MTNAAKELLVNNEKGLAMVLAIMLVTLLASFGMWLLLETHSGFRITSAFQRIEETFHMAEGACWFSVRAIDTNDLSLPTNPTIDHVKIPATETYMAANQSLGRGHVTPETFSARNFFNSTSPPGWMLNWQGGSGYHRRFYLSKGESSVPIPAQGDSKSTLYNLAEKVTR